MMNLLIAFYIGGYVASLLNARSKEDLTITGSLYLLLWPLYGIITIVELLNKYSDTIWAVTKAVIGLVVNTVKWFFGLFKDKDDE